MLLQEQVNLLPYNTFHISAQARYFSAFANIQELETLLDERKKKNSPKMLVLGGGSNILLTGDFDGLVAKNEITGIDVIDEDDASIYIKVGAGINWHQFVLYCVQNNYAGIENLSLIPGNVGA